MLPAHEQPSCVQAPTSLPVPFGKYWLRGLLASGGMANVHAAEVPRNGRMEPVAIKRMRAELSSEPKCVSMFLEEARLGLLLSHPHICKIRELGREKGEYFLAMEYLHGVTLGTLLGTQPLPPRIATAIAIQICEGLHFAHEVTNKKGEPLRLVHRDIAPSNIFVCTDGTAKVLDFGIAKAEERLFSTTMGTLKGNYYYMSPEQLRSHGLDRRSDIWSLAVVLLETLTGSQVFLRDTVMQSLYAIGYEPTPSLSELCSDTNPALNAAITRALSKNASSRFATADDFRSALLAAQAKQGVATREEVAAFVQDRCGLLLAQRNQLFLKVAKAATSAPEKKAKEATQAPPPKDVTSGVADAADDLVELPGTLPAHTGWVAWTSAPPVPDPACMNAGPTTGWSLSSLTSELERLAEKLPGQLRSKPLAPTQPAPRHTWSWFLKGFGGSLVLLLATLFMWTDNEVDTANVPAAPTGATAQRGDSLHHPAQRDTTTTPLIAPLARKGVVSESVEIANSASAAPPPPPAATPQPQDEDSIPSEPPPEATDAAQTADTAVKKKAKRRSTRRKRATARRNKARRRGQHSKARSPGRPQRSPGKPQSSPEPTKAPRRPGVREGVYFQGTRLL